MVLVAQSSAILIISAPLPKIEVASHDAYAYVLLMCAVPGPRKPNTHTRGVVMMMLYVINYHDKDYQQKAVRLIRPGRSKRSSKRTKTTQQEHRDT